MADIEEKALDALFAIYNRYRNPSKQAWYKEAGNLLLVRVPVIAVFGSACVVVPHGSVHQKNREVYAVKIRHRRTKPRQHAPGKAHEPIPSVIYLPSSSPPP